MKSLFLLFMVAPLLAWSQGSSSGASYLKLPFHARTAATAEAFIADSSAFASISLNPANLYSEFSTEVLFSHSQWIQDVQADVLGARISLPVGTFAFLVSNSSVRGIEIRDTPGPSSGTFNSHASSLQLSFASRVMADVVAGISAKYLYEKIFVDEATGYSFDCGATYRTPFEGLSLAASVTNLGGLSAFRSERNELPAQGRFGGTYTFREMDLDWVVGLSAVSELNQPATHVLAGAEVAYAKSFAFRLGYQTGFETRGFSTGFGFRYGFVKLDYAYLPFSLGFGDAHLVSIGVEL